MVYYSLFTSRYKAKNDGYGDSITNVGGKVPTFFECSVKFKFEKIREKYHLSRQIPPFAPKHEVDVRYA